MSNTIQIKRGFGSPAGRLKEGELGYTLDTNKVYIGKANDEVVELANTSDVKELENKSVLIDKDNTIDGTLTVTELFVNQWVIETNGNILNLVMRGE